MTDPQWSIVQLPKYSYYFSKYRDMPPLDVTDSTRITKHQGTLPAAKRTVLIKRFEPADLFAVLGSGNVRLDKAFVEDVLANYGPVFEPQDIGDWSFERGPTSLPRHATAENEFYGWYRWLVVSPVAHACNAVCGALNLLGADITIHGFMRAMEVYKTTGGGASDIIQRWVDWSRADGKGPFVKDCIPHEFKRDAVLQVNDSSTLVYLAELANKPGGYHFRAPGANAYSSHEGKLYHLICQASTLLQGGATACLLIMTDN
jgi:hypothetical protein